MIFALASDPITQLIGHATVVAIVLAVIGVVFSPKIDKR